MLIKEIESLIEEKNLLGLQRPGLADSKEDIVKTLCEYCVYEDLNPSDLDMDRIIIHRGYDFDLEFVKEYLQTFGNPWQDLKTNEYGEFYADEEIKNRLNNFFYEVNGNVLEITDY